MVNSYPNRCRFGGYLIAGLSRKYKTINNITYCYYEREATPDSGPTDKNGHPRTFLFLHGYTGSKVMWMSMVRYLPKEWRLILVDLPGHGESSIEFKEGEKYDGFGFADKIDDVSMQVYCIVDIVWGVSYYIYSCVQLFAYEHILYAEDDKQYCMMCCYMQ